MASRDACIGRNRAVQRGRRATAARLAGCALLACSLGALAAPAGALAAPQPGTIFAQNVGCTDPGDVTKFATKDDVYIKGSGIPAGTYYVNVTGPSGNSLNIADPGGQVTIGLDGILSCTQVTSVTPFDDTTNNGGVYSVSISSAAGGTGPRQKNFKLSDGGVVPPQSLVTVEKFYDANTDGVRNGTEPLITGWEVRAVGLSDDFAGMTTWNVLLDPGAWTISENTPVETNWLATTLTSVDITVPVDSPVQFGNVCIGGGGGGLTLGFWSNRNGQALVGSDDLAMLVALNLRTAAGGPFDPTGYAVFRTWILGATATNMAYMLSAQLAAMELNVYNGNVNGGSLIYAPGTTSANSAGFATVNAVMEEANTTLATNTNTTAGNVERTHQEALKNALDRANNNLNFVQGTPCAFSFATA